MSEMSGLTSGNSLVQSSADAEGQSSAKECMQGTMVNEQTKDCAAVVPIINKRHYGCGEESETMFRLPVAKNECSDDCIRMQRQCNAA